MIYLILKMFLYLLLALGAGVGAGWLLRNLAATKREEELARALTEARARVPQFEAQLRAREDQGKRMRDEAATKERVIAELMGEIRAKEDALKEKERELKKLSLPARNGIGAEEELREETTTTQRLDYGAIAGAGSTDDAASARIAELERALGEARATAANAVAEAAAAEAEVMRLKAALAARAAEPAASIGSSVSELEAKLAEKVEELERQHRALATEKRRVAELERERELMNKSLQVLHQQLELERERGQRAANG